MLGAEIVAGALAADQVGWLRAHHERWDGTGVPDGLSGEEIPMGARILAVADRWERLVGARPAGEGLPVPRALRRIDADADAGALCPVASACLGRAVRSAGAAPAA